MEKKKSNEVCNDKRCHEHGSLSVRGRTFKGYVKRIVGSRAVIEWERIIYYSKYERYGKAKGRMHSHIPQCLLNTIKVGDYVKIGECRPLSKIVHSVVLEVLKHQEKKK